jgi:AcrR family transcriptional regulator
MRNKLVVRFESSRYSSAMQHDRRPRRRNDPEGLRGRVLDAAFDLFQARGYNGTSMQDIWAAAG